MTDTDTPRICTNKNGQCTTATENCGVFDCEFTQCYCGDTETPRPMSELRYAYDKASGNGDEAALVIMRGFQIATMFIGKDADIVHELLSQPQAHSGVENKLNEQIAIHQDILGSHSVCPRDFHYGAIKALQDATAVLRPYLTQRPVDLEVCAIASCYVGASDSAKEHRWHNVLGQEERNRLLSQAKAVLEAAQTPYTEKGRR